MDIKKKTRRCMKRLLIILFFIAFIISGCKGKEEKQPVAEAPISEQQAKEGAPVSPGAAPSGETAISQPGGTSNTPPKVTSLDLSPRIPVIGDKIQASIKTFDQEGDEVNVTYEWSRNDITLSEDSDTLLLTDDFKPGDKITLKVTPDDGKRKGNPISVVITVANSSPVIHRSQATFRIDGNSYSYQVKATDPDGDPLTYSLKSAPSGMTIDSSSGLVKWNVPADFKGKAPVTISVTDGQGGEVMQSFTLDIMPEKR